MTSAVAGKFQLPTIPKEMTVSVLESNPDIALLIGHVVGRWAMIERLLAIILRISIKSDQQTAEVILYSLGNFKAKLDVTRNSVSELRNL